MARTYPLKRGVPPDPQRIEGLLRECFGVAPESRDGRFTLRFGSFARLTCWLEDKSLMMESEPAPGTPKEAIQDTIRRFNDFLFKATGFTSKERTKRMGKVASKEADA